MVLVALLATLGLFLSSAPAPADECLGLNRWDCSFHPGCTAWNGNPGHCYFTGHTYCWCHDLTDIVADACDLSPELTDGTFDFTYPIGNKTNNYTLPASNPCTGYTANGPDAVADVYLAPGGSVEVHMDPDGAMDSSLYIITDCGDPAGTCVMGADATLGGQEETLTFMSAEGGLYHIVFDAWTTTPSPQNVHAWGIVQGSAPTTVQPVTWGTIKAMYR